MKRQSKPEKIKKEKSTAPGEWLYFAPANVTVRSIYAVSYTHLEGRRKGCMKKFIHVIDESLEEILMVLMLAAMTLIMGCQVFSRYILGAVSYTHLDVYKRQTLKYPLRYFHPLPFRQH